MMLEGRERREPGRSATALRIQVRGPLLRELARRTDEETYGRVVDTILEGLRHDLMTLARKGAPHEGIEPKGMMGECWQEIKFENGAMCTRWCCGPPTLCGPWMCLALDLREIGQDWIDPWVGHDLGYLEPGAGGDIDPRPEQPHR